MTNELCLQWRALRDKVMRGDEEEDTVPVMIETGDMLVREIERLQKREKDLMDVIDSRDRALDFVSLEEPKAPNEICPHCQLPRQGAHSCMDSMRAEIIQLRGNLSLAEEGLANYALEVDDLKKRLDFAATGLGVVERRRDELKDEVAMLRLRLDTRELNELVRQHTSDEPKVCASRDADHCDYPDCEQHWELVVDWALAAMKKLHESAEPDTDHPEIPAIIPAAAFRAFVDEHARLMRIRASAPQGASRDASQEMGK